MLERARVFAVRRSLQWGRDHLIAEISLIFAIRLGDCGKSLFFNERIEKVGTTAGGLLGGIRSTGLSCAEAVATASRASGDGARSTGRAPAASRRTSPRCSRRRWAAWRPASERPPA